MRHRNKRIIFVLFLLILAGYVAITSNVSIRQGVDGHIRRIEMPLYVKGIQFLARHYEYVRLADEITVSCKTDEEKALAIFDWVDKNIGREIPEGTHIIDDHILNIIIRGYGPSDQVQDVFTTLCTYAKIPAFMYFAYAPDRKDRIILSVASINKRYVLFDAYNGNIFRNSRSDLASIEDIMNDPDIVDAARSKPQIDGIPYKDFFYNLKPVDKLYLLRAEQQMPLKRLFFELKKLIDPNTESLVFYGK